MACKRPDLKRFHCSDQWGHWGKSSQASISCIFFLLTTKLGRSEFRDSLLFIFPYPFWFELCSNFLRGSQNGFSTNSAVRECRRSFFEKISHYHWKIFNDIYAIATEQKGRLFFVAQFCLWNQQHPNFSRVRCFVRKFLFLQNCTCKNLSSNCICVPMCPTRASDTYLIDYCFYSFLSVSKFGVHFRC